MFLPALCPQTIWSAFTFLPPQRMTMKRSWIFLLQTTLTFFLKILPTKQLLICCRNAFARANIRIVGFAFSSGSGKNDNDTVSSTESVESTQK